MINYMLQFIQNHIIIILVILSSLVILSLASKRFRNIMYGGILTGSISLMFAILHKLGYGFSTFYSYFEKVVRYVTRSIEVGQSFLISGKTAFSSTLVSLDSDQLVRLLLLNDTFYSIALKIVILDLQNIFDEIKIKVENKIVEVKERLVVKSVNRTTLNCVYRL